MLTSALFKNILKRTRVPSSRTTSQILIHTLPPAFREMERDSGRANGGLAQLSSNNCKVKTVRIPTKNFRLQAQVQHFPKTRLLWINSYLPTDPLTVRFNDEELIEVLTEVENLNLTMFCGEEI